METKEEMKVKEEPKIEDKEDKTNLSLIEQAQEASGRLQDLLGSYKKENDRLEQLRAATILGGKGIAGQPEHVKPKMTDSEFSAKALKGELTKDDLE